MTIAMPKITNQRSKRSHRLGGCQNCRQRHTKCDQVRPLCLTCQALGLECQGYTPTVQWVTDDMRKNLAAEVKSGTRQHLYSEQSRQSMTSQLLLQIRHDTLDDSLAEIDQWNDSNQVCAKSVGPFSVMRLDTSTSHKILTVDLPSGIPDNELSLTKPPLIPEFSTTSPDCLQWSDLFDLDFHYWLREQPDDFDLSSTPDFSQNNSSLLLSTTLTPVADVVVDRVPISIENENLTKAAPFLIKHFLDHVINAIAALPFNTKSPIKILHVSAAVQTHADLNYLGRQVKHANISNLYAILACSAHHLGFNPSIALTQDTDHWLGLSKMAGMKAKEHLRSSLQTELFGEGRAKYKDQLIALMSVLIYCMMAGYKKDVRCYMIESERLLRLRGIAKKHISRRARLLHHMYTWIRIVGESTYVLHEYKHMAAQPRMTGLGRGRGHEDKLDDFLRVDRRSASEDPDLENVKDPETGRQDIHLEDPRDDPDSMYLHIYGLSEQWLSLLSQTTRLANFSEISKNDSELQGLVDKKAARLEDTICTFASNASTQPNFDVSTPTRSMLQALNSALVIYFYRRIRNVNSLILQSHVDHVINALKQFDSSMAQNHIEGSGTAFPAFIAGCEAHPGSRRDYLRAWIETAFRKTGFNYYVTANEVMQEVWLSRDQRPVLPQTTTPMRAGRTLSATWMEVSKQKGEWVILC